MDLHYQNHGYVVVVHDNTIILLYCIVQTLSLPNLVKWRTGRWEPSIESTAHNIVRSITSDPHVLKNSPNILEKILLLFLIYK